MTSTQMSLDLAGRPSARVILDRIRTDSRDESEKGRWFEQLFMRVALQQPEFEINEIRRWPEWPEREALTGLDGRDIGIDLVARRTTGEWVAIQCKCYDDRHTLGKGEIDKFLGGSQQPVFRLRWIVATCRWGPNAEKAIQNAHPQVGQVDFREYLDIEVEEHDAKRPVQEPWPLQADAIEDAIAGLGNHDRGRLVMACGTGKTFTALRIAEQLVEDGQRILFAAPTIALVSQARREWLRQTTRKLKCLVVCSDATAGGRNENEDIRISELECPVSTDPAEIARSLAGDGPTRVVFCTYHSLGRVIVWEESSRLRRATAPRNSLWPSLTRLTARPEHLLGGEGRTEPGELISRSSMTTGACAPANARSPTTGNGGANSVPRRSSRCSDMSWTSATDFDSGIRQRAASLPPIASVRSLHRWRTGSCIRNTPPSRRYCPLPPVQAHRVLLNAVSLPSASTSNAS